MQGLRVETGAGGRASSVSSARQTVRKTRIAALGPFVVDAVYRRDCIEAMREIPDRAIDVAIADPPYNLSKGGRWAWDNSVALPGFGGDWNKVMAQWDDMPLADYVAFTLSWLKELQRVVKPTGSLWVHGTYHNSGIINVCLQLLGIEIINEVIWYKRNSFPNLSGRRLTASHETILWAHTGKRRQYHFDYAAAKAMACPQDALKEQGKQLRTVWDIPNNKRPHELAFGKHPAQKPLRLLARMLELSARPGDVVLAPFAGSGSECAAAAQLGMHYLGFETSACYVDICRRRLGKSKPRRPDSSKSARPSERSKKRTRETTIPSLIKWTGSKRAQAARIRDLMPEYRRYIEPFLGGGAVLYLAATRHALAADIYQPLIDFWKLVRADPELLASDYEKRWLALQAELDLLKAPRLRRNSGLPRYFYDVRRTFNQHQNPLDLNFLTRTCVNGIVRFNEQGHFNNSFHLSRRGMSPARFRHAVNAWRRVVRNVTFLCQDYEATADAAKAGDFVYFDPPYAGNRQRYVASLELARFFGVLERLNRRGVTWALSFDGKRGDSDLTHDVPGELFKRRLYLANGLSAVHKVLNGPMAAVQECLYLNY